MVLSTSSTLGVKTAPAEALESAVEACRAVLHEVRRRVDATVTNTITRNELRQGLRLAEVALTNASKAAAHRTASASSVAPPSLSSMEEHAATKGRSSGGGGRRSSTDHSHGHHSSLSNQVISSGCTPTSNAPPLPTRDEQVTRPTVFLPSQRDGPRHASPLGDGEEASTEKHASDNSLNDSSERSKGAPELPTKNTAETCLPLCSPPQTAALYGFVLSAVFWKRRKLTEYALTAIEALLRAVAVPQDLNVTLMVDPTALSGGDGGGGHGTAGDRKGRRGNTGAGAGHRRTGRISVAVGTAVYYSLGECLTQSFAEPAVQTRALRVLNALIEESAVGAAAIGTSATTASNGEASNVLFRSDNALEDFFRNQAATRTIEACYAVAVEGIQEVVRQRARLVLRTAVRHVVRAFVTMQMYGGAVVVDADGNSAEPHTTFATDTILADYTVDVDHGEPFTPIHIVPSGKAATVAASSSSPRIGGRNNTITSDSSHTRAQASVDGGGSAEHEAPNHNSNGSPIARDALTAAPTPAGHASSLTRDSRVDADDSRGANNDSSPKRTNSPAPPKVSPAGVSFEAQALHLSSDSFVRGGHSSGRSGGSAQLAGLSFNPHLLFTSSIDDSLVTDALSTLNDTDGALPSSLKDLLMLLRRMCRYATRPCSGALSDSNVDIRARDLSLWVLEITLEGFPVANCEQEHRCAVWMSLVMHACKYELLGCLSRNLAMPAPFSFFARALHLLEMLLRKLHYHLARELHTLLGAFLLPLMASRYAGFRQKHAVLSMIRQLFSVPHLCVSFFVNYDCNPAFDAGAEYGGLLELLVEHVVETTFLDHVNDDGDAYPWLTSDQQQLLRSECVVVIHTFMSSLQRWIAEDPQEYAVALRRTVQRTIQRQAQKQQSTGDGAEECTAAADEVAELYLDNWAADEVTYPEQTAGVRSGNGDAGDDAPSSGSGALHTRNLTIVSDAASGQAVPHWGKNRNIEYHWKHIHYLLHNKRIAQEAVQRINAGNWQDAKAFLESRGSMAAISASEAEISDPTTVGPGESSYFLFAHFLFDYPGISRDSLSKIFESVNKKGGASRLVLVEYLHCFNYVDVPIDIAMRDTTCKFMSWDRPMFESKVWETVQKCFGAEYARQNPNFITADDADTMAGVLLFLHSNLHNQIVKNNRMPVSQFVRDANDCLSFPMVDDDLQAMYNRVLGRKWELDIYGRTPQQAERERTLVRLSAKIHMGHAAKWRRQCGNVSSNNISNNNNLITNSDVHGHPHAPSTTADVAPPPSLQRVSSQASKDPAVTDADAAVLDEVLQGTETDSVSCHSSFAANHSPASIAASVPAAQNPNSSMDAASFQMWMSNDVALLDNTIPSYTDSKDTLKFKDEQHHAFLDVSVIYLSKLESVHRLYCIEGEAYRPQPYIVPYYAEHVRQILLMTYPHVMSCVYMGFRVLEEAPIARNMLDTIQVTYDIAAAFVLNLRDLRPVMEEAFQRYLDDERAYKLLPPSRATFVPLMLNTL
ncbi:hypothetical protein ABB37_01343 [Leptomonas pyrrhocoris]|uniref:SEC7 domain-containing protein n=1 Tax=Leptomonas pyrrhocoris TaxID=157538 RepID=A0A0M9G8U6_LEPPY|nr:hypothetical protein ABB37_01343 [Leptomonas pyrrhocoris]KPA84886.1 hypothetical protein ABB37_01343 [Leptomonas pyrrhocoris]|eukprot:XP_015663325.1 hypothetical protein ABB37_01343 [Leptomonas pyrrhocoris]